MSHSKVWYPDILKCSGKVKSKFVKAFENYDDVTVMKLTSKILNKTEKVALSGDVDGLKNLNWFVNYINSVKKETFLDYFTDSTDVLQKRNLLILMCKHNYAEFLEYIFSEECIALLSVLVKLQIVSLTASDEETHNAIYYAVRSNNIQLLDILIHKWPNDYFDNNKEELDKLLSSAYEELKLKNVLLTDEMQAFVENLLIDLRFFHNSNSKPLLLSTKLIKSRIEVLIESIEKLKTSSIDKVDERFIYLLKFIARNVYVLKRQLKCTYLTLPWEEIEFCLIAFVCSHTTDEDINLIYSSVLNKTKVLAYLDHFSCCLLKEFKPIETVEIKHLLCYPKMKREDLIKNIISTFPEFEPLYTDYEAIRDIHSLEIVKKYIELSLSANPNSKEGQLVVIRALQVCGEYFKNTVESPKLSSYTCEMLLSLLPRSTRQIIIDLRNSLSHSYSLQQRLKIEEYSDVDFFKNIQNDVKKIGIAITEILFRNKIAVIKLFLSKIDQSNNLEHIKQNIEVLYDLKIENILPEENSNLLSKEISEIEKLVREVYLVIPQKTHYEIQLLQELEGLIKQEKSKFENFEQNYVSGIMCCITFLKQIFNFNLENEKGLRLIKSHTSPVLNKMSLKIESVNLVRILHISVELLKCISLKKDVEEQDKLRNLLYKICFLAETQVGNMKWITELRDKLNYLRNSDTHIVSFKDITPKDEQIKHLVSKVSVLEKALSRNDFNDQLVHKFSTYKGNKNLQVVVEMLLLDIMCILEDSNKNLTHNLLFLDEISPVLVGRNLRNHLAHGNALFDILQNEASVAIAINAKKLISENIVLHQKNKIGKVINNDPIKLKNRYEQELNYIDIQTLYFNALVNGNFEDMKKHIKDGADVQAKSLHSWTSLHFASQGGNVKIVAFLLGQKLNVNAKDKNGQTPIHIASVFGHKDIIKELLENNANIEAKDSHLKTPLHLAAKNGYTDVIKLLLKYNASVSAKDLVNGTAIHYAIVYNHIEAIKILIAKQNIDAVVILTGYTSLHVAADNGLLELVNLFLKLKANVNAQTDDLITPLHLASFDGNLDIVKTLILAKAQINVKTVEGGTPLHCAVENNQKEIAELLLEQGADINAVNGYGLTPLHFAAAMGNLDIVELLVEKKCSINLVTNENITSLYFAAEKGHHDVVSFLLKRNASLSTKCCRGFSALHIAANNGHNDVVKLLIEGGSIVNDRDVRDQTPLHLATINNNLKVVATLISLGADIDIKDKEGLTALHISCQNGHESIAEHLIANGANLTTQNKNGDIPMFLAVKSGSLSTTKLLIKNGADITFVNKSGLTALHVSAFYGNTDILKLFLHPNSDINVLCVLGLSPLHCAVQGNHRKTVNFLLKKGANINAKDLSGHTPLCFAVRNNCIEIVNDLIMFGADTNIGCPLLISIGLNYPDIAQVLIHNEKCDISAHDEIRTNLTPLHMAALKGQRNVVKALLVRGADINSKSNNQTALHYAASEGHNNVVNVLLTNKSLMNLQTDEGYTPLFMATMSGHEKVVETLLNGGADPYITDFQNRTCLEMAVANNELKLLEILLRHCIVKINDKEEKGITLLHIAAYKGFLDITELLVANGADINAINIRGLKPFHQAALSGHKNIVKFYLEKESEGFEDSSSQLPVLHCAALGGNLEIVKYLISNRKMDINLSNYAGNKPLHVAASLGHCDVIHFLLENGAYLNARNSHNYSALDITKSRGHKQATKLLEITEKYFDAVKQNNICKTDEYLKEGAAVNVKNNSEVTPLIYASWKGFNNIVNILLTYKANPNITGKSGCSPLHYACKFNHHNIVKSLLSYKARYNVSCCNGKTPVDFATHKGIKEMFGFINKSFQSVQNKDTSIISELNNLKDKDVVKIVMNAYNRDDKTLIILGVHSGFPKIEQLKKILNDGMSIELKVADDLCYEERYEEALVVFKEVHEKRKHLFGPENPDTLEMQLMVGKVLLKLQKFNEALEVSEDVCQKQKDLLGEENEDTMRTKRLIALIFYMQGRNEDALALYDDFLPKQIKLLGQNHSDVLDTRNEFALVLCALGKFEEALEENYDILKIQTKKYGISHPKALVTQNNIGIVLNEQGKHTEALEMFQKVYETRKRVMGPNHSDTLRASHWIAGITSHTKQNDNLYHEILEHQRKVLGPDHLDTLTTQHNHANFLFSQGMIKESLKIYLEIIDRLKDILGPNHSYVTDIEKKIAAIKYGKTLAGDTSSDFSQPNYSSDSPIVSESMQHFPRKNSEHFQDEAILTQLHQDASEGNEPLLASNSILSLMKVDESGTIKQFSDKNAANDPTKFGVSQFLHNTFAQIFKQLLSPDTGENFLTIERPQIFMNFPEKDIFGQDKTSIYPLHYAASVGNKDLLTRLLDAGADVMRVPMYGYTPLHIAASKGFTDLVGILIKHVEKSANLKVNEFLNVKTRYDETAALHVVSDMETAVVLLANGAVYNIKNKEGKTPLQVIKNRDIISLLSTIEEGFSAIEKGFRPALNLLMSINARPIHERAAIQCAQNLEGERIMLKIMDKYGNLTSMLMNSVFN